MKTNRRRRIVCFIAVVIVILLGLGSRKYTRGMPGWMGDYAGDTLWALMIFFGAGFIFKKWSTWKTAAASLLFSFVIEASQLYHAPWIDEIRRTTLGALVLGFGFLWSDIVCYTVGVIIGVAIEKLVLHKIYEP